MTPATLTLRLAGLGLSAGLFSSAAAGATLNFQFLTLDDANATPDLPSATGCKPSVTMRTAGDWLVFTADDAQYGGVQTQPSEANPHY